MVVSFRSRLIRGEGWKQFERFVSHLQQGFLICSGILIAFLMALLFVDVVCRYVFNNPLPIVYEFSESVLMVAVVFLGVAGAEHVSMRVVTQRLRGKTSQIVQLISLLVSIVLIGLMTWQCSLKAIWSFKLWETAIAIKPFPLFPARFITALGLFVLLLVLTVSFIKRAKGGDLNE